MEKRGDMEMLLSAWRDGELAGAEKELVERALREDPVLQARLRDLDALSGFVRVTLEAEADAVDFTGLADRVVSQVPARKPSVWKRIRVSAMELLEYRRWQVVATAGALAVLLTVAPALLERRHAPGEELLLAGGPDLARVLTVNPANDTDAMLITTASGATVIYVQER